MLALSAQVLISERAGKRNFGCANFLYSREKQPEYKVGFRPACGWSQVAIAVRPKRSEKQRRGNAILRSPSGRKVRSGAHRWLVRESLFHATSLQFPIRRFRSLEGFTEFSGLKVGRCLQIVGRVMVFPVGRPVLASALVPHSGPPRDKSKRRTGHQS